MDLPYTLPYKHFRLKDLQIQVRELLNLRKQQESAIEHLQREHQEERERALQQLSQQQQQLEKCQARANAERRRSYASKGMIDNLRSQVKGLQTLVDKRGKGREKWKKKAVKRAAAAAVLGKKKFVPKIGRRYKAVVRETHYRLFSRRVAGNQHRGVIKDVARMLGVSVSKKQLCSRTQIQRFRVESGVWAHKSASKALAEAKNFHKENFSVAKSRDGTNKRGTQHQINVCHFRDKNDKMTHAALNFSILSDKTASTQAKATLDTLDTTCFLSGGVVSVDDFQTCVTDGANNEGATNRKEGPHKATTTCLTHNITNSVRHGVAPTKTTHLVRCPCGQPKPPPPTNRNQDSAQEWAQCVVCEVWVHTVCMHFDEVPSSFLCARCTEQGADAMEGDVEWQTAKSQLYAIIKAIHIEHGQGIGGELRDWCALQGPEHTVYALPRDIGDRFFGVFFACACILCMLATFDAFLSEEGNEEGKQWVKELVRWLHSEGGQVFLCTGAVIHGALAKDYFRDVHKPDLTVTEAYPVVHTLTHKMEGFIANPETALDFDHRAKDLVQASPLRINILCRLHTIFTRMHKRWISYTSSYHPGGSTCIPELDDETIRALSNTPASTNFAESTFGTLTDSLAVGGPRISPWRASGISLYRQNKHIVGDMTEEDAWHVMTMARSVETIHGTQEEVRRRVQQDKVARREREKKKEEERAAKQAAREAAKVARAAEKQAKRTKRAVHRAHQREQERAVEEGRTMHHSSAPRTAGKRISKPNPRYQ